LKKNKLLEFLSYPIVASIFIISKLPLWLLYPISKVIYLILYYLTNYRKGIAYKNLRNSFPEKTEAEILAIRKKFYKHLSNLFIETIKLLGFSQKELVRRCKFTPEAKELIEGYLSKNKSIIIVIGHYGNWEWGGASFYPSFSKKLITAYRPVKNRVIDRLMKRLRERFGIIVRPKNDLPKEMFAQRNNLTATALIADQTPSPSNAHWVDFLNQDTPVFKGTSKLSKMYNYPIIFCSTRLIKRGFYEIEAWLLTESPKEHDEYSLSVMHTKMLEKEIERVPETWLWSHKRWKHKKLKENNNLS